VSHAACLRRLSGCSATDGESLIRQELSDEAIRLARLMYELLPDPEVMGLLALMLLHESRRAAYVVARVSIVAMLYIQVGCDFDAVLET
jgi:RNA polymerase sigma-70 factor (ECF subfamily)